MLEMCLFQTNPVSMPVMPSIYDTAPILIKKKRRFKKKNKITLFFDITFLKGYNVPN